MSLRWTLLALVLTAGCVRFQPRPIVPAETAAALTTRRLSDAALREFLETNLQHSLSVWPPPSWDFEMLFLAALYYHPALDVARAQWATAVGGTRTAAARPNPILSAIPGYDLSPTQGLSPWIPQVTFDWPVETGGKRGYRMDQARHLTEAARLNIATTAWQVRSNLRASLIDLTVARQRQTRLAQQKAIQERIIRLLEQQLQAGAVSNSELTLMRIALGQIQLELSDAQQQTADAQVRVADAVGVSAAALEGLNIEYDLSTPPAETDLLSAEVRRQALVGRGDLLSSLEEYAARQAALQLEIAKQYPDIHLGPGYQYDQGDHKVMLALTAELPVLNQNRGPIAEAEARRTEAAARFNALQARVMAEIDRAVATYRVAQTNMATLDALAASHRARNQAVEAQMRAGAADQLELLNSQIELGASELIQLTGRVKLQQAYGALEDAVQRPLVLPAPKFLEQSARSSPHPEVQP